MELGEILEQHFCCDICMDKYRNPKQLPCLHNFCKSCLGTHIMKTAGTNGNSTFICPVCRHVCHPADPDPRRVHEWADAFPDNFYIKNLIDTVEANKTKPSPAVVERKLKTLSQEPETCSKHKGESITTYCVDKQVSVCGICLKSSAHDECASSHFTPEDARRVSAERLHDFKHRIEVMSSKIRKAEKNLQARPDELKFKKEEVAAEISHHFSGIRTSVIKMLISEEKAALKELNSVIKNGYSMIAGANDEIKSLSGSLTSTEQLFDKLLENRPVGVLSISEAVENQISTYEGTTDRVKAGCGKLNISFKPCSNLHVLMEKFNWGDISGGTGADTSGKSTRSSRLSSVAGPNEGACQLTEDVSSLSLFGAGIGTVPNGPPSVSSEDETLLLRPALSEVSIQAGTNGSQNNLNQASSAASLTLGAVGGVPDMQMEASGGSLNSLQVRSNSLTSNTSTCSEPAPIQTSPPLYSRDGFYVSFVREFNGLDQDDKCGASYVGSCPFGENCFLILDRWNRRLKLFQVGGRLLLHLQFPDRVEPWALTVVSSALLTVSCPSSRQIVRVNVTSSSLELSTRFNTSVGYSSLVYMSKDVHVGGICSPYGNPCLEVLEISDNGVQILRKLQYEVIYPRCLITTGEGHLLTCDWSKKEVNVYDRDQFSLKLRYKGIWRENPLREPVCVARDRKNNIYVLDRRTKSIHVVSHATGQMAAIFPIGVAHDPKVVAVVDAESCYSSDGEVLLLFCGNGKICVYDIVTP